MVKSQLQAQSANASARNSVAVTLAPTTAPRRIRLLLVDDHPVVRKGLIACLAHQPNLVVVGEATNGQEAIQKAKELEPDVLLMDIDMPVMNGLTATVALRNDLPQAKVLIVTSQADSDCVKRIVQSGARGCVLKDASPSELSKAIELVDGGNAFFSPAIAPFALNQFVRGTNPDEGGEALTAREREVLIQIAEGRSNKEIASVLNIGSRTVETHRERLMRKLGIRTIAGLTKYALAHGLVSLPRHPPV